MDPSRPDLTEQLDGMRTDVTGGGKPPATIKVGLLNVQSLNNKAERIRKLIEQNNLGVFLTTETWLQLDNANTVLRQASPPEFSFFHSQEERRGGGVAIQYKEDLNGVNKRADRNPETFEYVAAVLKHAEWDKRVLFINVYRPSGPSIITKAELEAFLEEFKELLDELSVDYNSIIITGDFNIHVDVETETTTRMFKKFLEENNLIQHVVGPTHQSGHTLDLVITRNVEISDLTVRRDIEISDHYLVTFNARPV